ncbi:GAP family protein [Nocardia arizonensis]|uniref:GAP family protein n=1 Tax=Nocardia arizonensis TaxID=1141647 RepID=UPI0006D1E980|nr:GAP family protein [Nocardia arizonensis]
MGELFWQLLPEMIGLLVTPAAVVGCVLLLQSGNAVRNAYIFGAAFLLVYSQIGVAGLLGGAGEPHAASPAVAHWVGLLVGLLFLAIGAWLLLRRPVRGGRPPGWAGELGSAVTRKAFAVGLVLAVLNPNLLIMLSGVSVIAGSGVGVGGAIGATALLLFCAALDFLIPIGMYILLGVRARAVLDVVKRWMVVHDRLLAVCVFVGFGLLFTGRGLVALA